MIDLYFIGGIAAFAFAVGMLVGFALAQWVRK